jgi:hypothetical protein
MQRSAHVDELMKKDNKGHPDNPIDKRYHIVHTNLAGSSLPHKQNLVDQVAQLSGVFHTYHQDG